MKWGLLSLGLLLGCPTLEPPVASVCVKAYEKCKLPEGPLGVCETVPCQAGQAAPCFKCNSQH